jgi:Mrp family chromosome partitioning ATPase
LIPPTAPKKKEAAEAPNPEWSAEPGANPSDRAGSQSEPVLIDESALTRGGLLSRREFSRLAEEFRIVEAKLVLQAFGETRAPDNARRSNLILVTSALAGEGKSFISMNIAAGLALQSGRRVILADADAKPGSLVQRLFAAETPGLLDLARDRTVDAGSLIVRTAVDNLDVLPLGRDARQSAELFASPLLATALRDLSKRYADRIILLDAPPCLSSSVPHALVDVVGQIVFVVGACSTQQEDLEAALGLLQTCPEIGLLLNKVPLWNAHSFGLYNYPPT